MNLSQLNRGQSYIISKINDAQEHVLKRYFQLGIVPGAKITMKRKAPIFKDPIIFEVDDSQIVLTKSEAKLVEVYEGQV